jgi:hypothetical protein
VLTATHVLGHAVKQGSGLVTGDSDRAESVELPEVQGYAVRLADGNLVRGTSSTRTRVSAPSARSA